MKSIQQRKTYIAHKSAQLDNQKDAHKYTRRLTRVMLYHKLLSELEVAAVNKLVQTDELQESSFKQTKKEVTTCPHY